MPSSIRTKSSKVEVGGASFLVTHMPTNDKLAAYVEDLKNHGVTHLVRVCKPEYDDTTLRAQGIILHDWPFADGSHPPQDVIDQFFSLTREVFKNLVKADKKPTSLRERAASVGSRKDRASTSTPPPKPGPIALHCVSGLGRAPVLVALFCMHSGMTAEQAVEHIRKNRYGALNDRQVTFLKKYTVPEPTAEEGKKCVIM